MESSVDYAGVLISIHHLNIGGEQVAVDLMK